MIDGLDTVQGISEWKDFSDFFTLVIENEVLTSVLDKVNSDYDYTIVEGNVAVVDSVLRFNGGVIGHDAQSGLREPLAIVWSGYVTDPSTDQSIISSVRSHRATPLSINNGYFYLEYDQIAPAVPGFNSVIISRSEDNTIQANVNGVPYTIQSEEDFREFRRTIIGASNGTNSITQPEFRDYFYGDMCEIGIFDETLDVMTQVSIFEYLRNKWQDIKVYHVESEVEVSSASLESKLYLILRSGEVLSKVTLGTVELTDPILEQEDSATVIYSVVVPRDQLELGSYVSLEAEFTDSSTEAFPIPIKIVPRSGWDYITLSSDYDDLLEQSILKVPEYSALREGDQITYDTKNGAVHLDSHGIPIIETIEESDSFELYILQASSGYLAPPNNDTVTVRKTRNISLSVRTNQSLGNIRVAFSEDSTLATNVRYASLIRSMEGERLFRLTQLSPNTEYYYALELNGTIDISTRSSFRTLPIGTGGQFRICLTPDTTEVNPNVFETIQNIEPDLFIHLGNYGLNPNGSDGQIGMANRFRNSVESHELFKNTTTYFLFGETDVPNTSYEAFLGDFRGFYRTTVPTPPVYKNRSLNEPIFYSTTIGRTKIIYTDLISDKIEDSPMGYEQEHWFLNECKKSVELGQKVMWISAIPWHSNESGWVNYPEGKQRLIDSLFDLADHLLIVSMGGEGIAFLDDTIPVLSIGLPNGEGLNADWDIGPFTDPNQFVELIIEDQDITIKGRTAIDELFSIDI